MRSWSFAPSMPTCSAICAEPQLVRQHVDAWRGRDAIDSLCTKALRTLGPHFEHRLFLSATPHNDYRTIVRCYVPQRGSCGGATRQN